ncbi:MAG: hypothetical protein ACKO58_02290, partial [Cyanobium sp.]
MLELLLALMRFLSWRLKPKAAARPRAGRGPGTSVAWAHVYDVFGLEVGQDGVARRPLPIKERGDTRIGGY